MSPFTTVLKFHLINFDTLPSNSITALLQSSLDDIAFSTANATVSFLEVLVCSLRRSDQWKAEASLFGFLDECFTRLAQKPVKYYDDLMGILYEIGSDEAGLINCSIGLFLAVVLEQWSFLAKSASSCHLQNVSGWLSRYLNYLMHAGENLIVLSYFRKSIQQRVDEVGARLLLQTPSEDPVQTAIGRIPSNLGSSDKMNVIRPTSFSRQDDTIRTQFETTGSAIPPPPSLPVEVHDEHFVTSWTKKEIGRAILDGDVGILTLCLCSKYEEVRKQALNDLRIILGKLEVGPLGTFQT